MGIGDDESEKDWHALLAWVVHLVLHILVHRAAAMSQADIHVWIQFLNALLVPQANVELQQALLRSMLFWGLYRALQAAMLALPSEQSHTGQLCVTLMLHPFHLLPDAPVTFVKDVQNAPPTTDARSIALRAFVANGLTVPHLLQRVPIDAVAQFTSAFPFAQVMEHIYALGACYRTPGATALANNPIHSPYLLGNLLVLCQNRVPLLRTSAELSSYLDALVLLQDALPSTAFVAPEDTNASSEHASTTSITETDEQNSPTQHPTDAASVNIPLCTLPLDPNTYRNLRIVVSEAHLHAIMAASVRFSHARPALCAFLLAALQSWPSAEREVVLNTVLYGYDSHTARNAAPAQRPSVGSLVRELWRGWTRASPFAKHLSPINPIARVAETRAVLLNPAFARDWAIFTVLCALYSRTLMTMGDDEFYPSSKLDAENAARNPLTLDELVTISSLLRNIAFTLYWHEDLQYHAEHDLLLPGARRRLPHLRAMITELLQQLHTRDSRRRFTPDAHWHMLSQQDLASFIESVVWEERSLMASSEEEGFNLQSRRSATLSARTVAFINPRLGVLNNIPFVIPFDVRVEIFRHFVRSDSERLGISRDIYAWQSQRRVTIRRGAIAEDGMAQLNALGPHLKGPLQIVFVDQWGMQEDGIDGGGVFKEFLTSLVQEVFHTDRGLWCVNQRQELYPNPHSYAQRPEQLNWYAFLGRIIGKALYEGILVDAKFASFFLGKWLGHQSYLDDLASLDSLDRELYKGLIVLKNYTGNVENDFALNFTVTDEEFGATRTTELIPGGTDISVTRSNRLSYIYHVTRYRLSKQIEPQCRAFFDGLSELIDPRWLRLLNREELHVLVSGAEKPIDLDNLREHTLYGGFHEKDLAITFFWEALASLDQDSRRAFLRFVTSSPNPPLRGFVELNPKFAIRNAGDDVSRLPTASTCVNLLKLPAYTSKEQALEKLRYAIHSQAGFDLE
ncbi:hypothetical protein MVES_001753 [Malassezia vespertilionis]|uniref:HECT-type E3 ubiquitin transferase n=2 Tax=Malassezia vespertilionis TaxID=2020962 RepID=A0A2N1JDF9_9BASI|nr:hypothetical protein MVES_001753 [Malassezia vespertilionis]